MTDLVDCVGTPTLFVHYNLTFNFFFLVFWSGFAFLGRFSFYFFIPWDHILVFLHRLRKFWFLYTHACYCIVHDNIQWTIQILCILWLKKGARKLQQVLLSRFFCSLNTSLITSVIIFCLEIFMKSSVLCRAGLMCFVTEEWSPPLLPDVSGFPGFVSKLYWLW